MNISFRKLSEKDFPLLLKWLRTSHVKVWWDNDISWSLEKIIEKYETYVSQYKLDRGNKKPIFSYIIVVDGRDVGYIQYYRARDFLTIPDLPCFPSDLAAIDMYIGEPDMLCKGIGSKSISQFIKNIVLSGFKAILVTPDKNNLGAIACYQKAGFRQLATQAMPNEFWLLYNHTNFVA